MHDRNLTAIERRGLRQSVNLADGHARQQLSEDASRALRQVCDDLFAARTVDVLDSEFRFLDALAARLTTKYPDGQSHVLYSASISVDLAAKLLRRRSQTVHLMKQAFDNLAALVAMNGVEIRSVPEQVICPVTDFDYLDQQAIESLFIILPNNPTGARLSVEDIGRLLDWCADHGVLLIMDMSFRLLIRDYAIDLLAEAESRGASTLIIDDTGKVLSLLDTKMSVVACTKDLAREVESICEEILLNTSAFEMELLAKFLDPHGPCADELVRVRALVAANRQIVQDTLRTSGVVPVMSPDEEMSVELVRFGPDCEEILRDCASHGLQLLPGRLFFWDAESAQSGREYARIALMRDTEQVEAGCEILRAVLAGRRQVD